MTEKPTLPPRPDFDAGVLIAEAVAKQRRETAGALANTVNAGKRSEAAQPEIPVAVAPAGASAAQGAPHPALLFFGVVYPGAVILIEAATGYCGKHLFDPMPTLWHLALLTMVPIGNLALWGCLAGSLDLSRKMQASITGFAIGIAGFYALLFLPLLPLALVAVLIGVGLLPFGPAVAVMASVRLAQHLKVARRQDPWSHKHVGAGFAAAVLGLVALDLPNLSTRYGMQLAASGDPQERAQGIAWLRAWGSHEVLLDQAMGRVNRPGGPLAIMLAMATQGIFDRPRPLLGTQQAREIHYRVTGTAFTSEALATAAPSGRAAERTWDQDLGGTQVGATVSGLSLSSSRIDGSINADDALAYIEWLFEVKNDGLSMSEARMAIALPPGAVVSRVTLWVNGIEEEAAFAGRAEVRQAYERVVRRSQDPFLVTTNGADRILAQAFPVMPNGGVMKFKLGITAPLELDSESTARLVLPAIVDRNFAAGDQLRHAVWLESKRSSTASTPDLVASPLAGGGTRLSGEIGMRSLATARPIIVVARDVERRRVVASNPETGSAVQEIVAVGAVRQSKLLFVVDGSAGTKAHVRPILTALDALPPGVPVGLVIAGEPSQTLAAEPWGPEQRARVREALLSHAYIGGADNTDGLIAAMLAAGSAPGARVVWIHGPQPVRFATSKARFEQLGERLRDPATLSLLALMPGPNMMLSDVPWAGAAQDVPATGDIEADLTRALRRMTGMDAAPALRRTLVTRPGVETEPHMPPPVSDLATGSSHIVRLAAHDEIQRLLRLRSPASRAAAIELAALHRLVTPVSGAVVLESKRQYVEAGLVQGMKGQAGNVPTVPEPHEWALILLAGLGLSWVLWSRRGGSLPEARGAA